MIPYLPVRVFQISMDAFGPMTQRGSDIYIVIQVVSEKEHNDGTFRLITARDFQFEVAF